MKVLGTSVLAFEAIVVLLATSLAASASGVNAGLAWACGFALMVLLILGAGMLRGKNPDRAVAFGWALQALVLASAIVVGWSMLIVGGIFVVLWFVAIRTGRRVDALRDSEGDASS